VAVTAVMVDGGGPRLGSAADIGVAHVVKHVLPTAVMVDGGGSRLGCGAGVGVTHVVKHVLTTAVMVDGDGSRLGCAAGVGVAHVVKHVLRLGCSVKQFAAAQRGPDVVTSWLCASAVLSYSDSIAPGRALHSRFVCDDLPPGKRGG
jgi:hypothetical protein